MKRFLKRTVAVLLTVCLMASVMVPMASAETVEVTYNFTSDPKTSFGDASAEKVDFQDGAWTHLYNHKAFTVDTKYSYSNLKSNNRYIALKLNGLEHAGEYTIVFKLYSDSGSKTNMYFVPGDTAIASAANCVSAINANGDPDCILESYATAAEQEFTITLKESDIVNGSVVLVMKGDNPNVNTNLRLVSLTMSTEVASQPAVAEAATEYSFDYTSVLGGYINLSVDNEDLNNAFAENAVASCLYAYNSPKAQVPYFAHTDIPNGIRFDAYPEGYIAFKVANPGVGTYAVDYTYVPNGSAGRGIGLYMIPLSVVEAGDLVALMDAADAGTNAYKVGEEDGRYGTGAITLNEAFEITENEQYIMAFRCNRANNSQGSAGRIYINSVTFTDTAHYTNLIDAVSVPASPFRTVKMLAAYTGNIAIPSNGCTLDLNGNTVTGSIVSTGNGRVVDSADGTGAVTGTVELASANLGYMPLANANGIGFYAYTDGKFEGNAYESGDYVLFWFDMNFSNPVAYELIASGNSGLNVGAELYVFDHLQANIAFDEVVTDWAESDHANADYAMGVAATNVDVLGANGKIRVQATFESEFGAAGKIGSRVTYTVPGEVVE